MPRRKTTEPRAARIRRLILRHLATGPPEGLTRTWLCGTVGAGVFSGRELDAVLASLVADGTVERADWRQPRTGQRFVVYRLNGRSG
jgi:hypothetical protein